MMFKITFKYTQTIEVEWMRFDNFESAEWWAEKQKNERGAKEVYIH